MIQYSVFIPPFQPKLGLMIYWYCSCINRLWCHFPASLVNQVYLLVLRTPCLSKVVKGDWMGRSTGWYCKNLKMSASLVIAGATDKDPFLLKGFICRAQANKLYSSTPAMLTSPNERNSLEWDVKQHMQQPTNIHWLQSAAVSFTWHWCT